MNQVLTQTALLAFLAGIILAPLFIRLFRQLDLGQQIREDGPRKHFKKAGTPTMGGVIFLLAFLPPVLIFAPQTLPLYLAVLMTLGNGLVGFFDDYLKVVRKQSLGLKARSKLLGQLLLVVLFFIAWRGLGGDTTLEIPFTIAVVDLGGIGYFFFLVLFFLGTTNAVNLTDGIDGLAAGTAILAFLAYTILAGAQESVALAQFGAAMIGGVFAFLIYNLHPARVFMGDVGSLALGGALASMAVLTKTELYLVIIGGVFVLETLSVIIQVIFFKLTGKRVFRMSPLHHHYELGGHGEWRVVTGFWAVGFLFAVVGLLELGAL
ncbi:MAG: phospho-N-acetylmuramoyl-pentapeptide-transferase [Dethiobacter sp.]|jgi:phospho-N-acetylmuramoyl-pentapeptide-transferase|nr:phospho-N-acetylmuramoyl-pentapeptide-transferase [Dethiobacter sp.]MBS3900253.1 phospho-N-acetylmuramoyl-pentapeptide-transferase [Dethiobacter sp.]MBS3983489.1 phospho-N-acetylmuramoyl-pentapeptide-transferase [Dethiobacter sp.]MCL4463959.1 phospho-N-acetylmuramoyl-pentapeptide-transferase [Bacillota bacterium]MCL5992804.1 phospho-N-acetylmuramoyl-pentapeptide-transferase [Bacillota bacterium]